MGEVNCSPLSGGDEGSKIYVRQVRRARRRWRCCECRDDISPGASYLHERVLTDYWGAYETCLLCAEIRDHFGKHTGWTWEMLWDDLEAYFFPDMKAGGPCMEGLSPEAKARLFDRCLAWRLR